MSDQVLVRWRRKAKPEAAPAEPETVHGFVNDPDAAEVTIVERAEPVGDALALPAGEQNPAAVYLASLGSEKSRRAMLGALRRILGSLGSEAPPLAFPWASIRYQHAAVIRSALVAHYGPATVNQALCALRGVMHESFRLGLVTGEDWARVKDVPGVRYERLPRGRAVAAGELASLFDACDRSTPIGVRDAALLAVLRVTGVRRAEVCAVDLDALDIEQGEIRVIGKGNKERLVYLGDAVAEVRAWLAVRGDAPGPLFTSFDPPPGGGFADPDEPPRRLTEAAVRFVLRRLAARAMVKIPPSPHDLRRTFVSDLLDAGADIVTVQQMAGHAQVTTTQRYDRRGEEPKRRAATLLKIPR
jgi:site-specific recombinase XerD